ncbi:MAG: response regulator [Planctomycetota bacterium]|nr:response regulator [Planctomycetota bacterium]
MFVNLCVNARDAIAGVGKLTIETSLVSFDKKYCATHPGFSEGDFVMLGVSDDGCGMDKATMDNIFEPFFTTKSTGVGTGLGLATVFGIVKQNNGFINVYSEPGKGTTFKIYFSHHKTDEIVSVERESSDISQGRGETVLIVEDDSSILELVQTLLVNSGYEVLASTSAADAIALAAEYSQKIHLLITDVVMPEINGRELARSLEEFYPELKVLFMSGYTANVIAHRGVLAEGVNFIQKPFSSRELAVAVRGALDS